MDFLFFIKTLFLTVALVLIMQIRVGDHTIEAHALSWVKTSAVVSPLNHVARGGAKLLRDLTQRLSNGMNSPDKKEKTQEAPSNFRWGFWTSSEQPRKKDQ